MARAPWTPFLAGSAGLLVLGVAGTRLWAGYWVHGFLLWNLVLALVPVGLALLIARVARRQRGIPLLAALLGLWLLFLPNAPYLVTDLVHFGWADGVPRLADGFVLGVAGLTGLLAGVISLGIVRAVVRDRFGRGAATALAIVVFPLVSLGVYLGRVVRLNSWDALLEPSSVVSPVLSALQNPGDSVRPLVAIIVFAGFLAATSLAYERLSAPRKQPEADESSRAG